MIYKLFFILPILLSLNALAQSKSSQSDYIGFKMGVAGKTGSKQYSAHYSDQFVRYHGGSYVDFTYDTPVALGLSLNIGLSYFFGKGRANYSFHNDKTNQSYRLHDLKFQSGQVSAELGFKFRFFGRSAFTFFTEIGTLRGGVHYSFDEDEIKNRYGTTDGFNTSEAQETRGYYIGAGMEIKPGSSGYQLGVRTVSHTSEGFESFESAPITMETTIFYFGIVQDFGWEL